MTDRAEFEATHVYSTAPGAAAKREIDRQIMSGDYAEGRWVRLDNEGYLRDLVRYASKGKIEVKDRASGLQFFIIEGGGEGLLTPDMAGIDASRYGVGGGTTTTGASGTPMVFDLNDILVVFDARGRLINSCHLARPIKISTVKDPLFWTEATAEKVYKAWDNGPVSLYRNTNFDIKYYGLKVDDSVGYYQHGWVRIDIHKREATNGCIFIMDPATPKYSKTNKDILSNWEPKFIKDIQAAIGASVKSNIGTMRMIEIK